MNNKIMLALDHLTVYESEKVIEETAGHVWGWKVRDQILEEGLGFIRRLCHCGKFMLDTKLYDIPSAITDSVKRHIDAGVSLTTIHASSYYEPEWPDLIENIVGVTVLTSFTNRVCEEVYQGKVPDTICNMLHILKENGYRHLICSAVDITQNMDSFVKICPGIRLIDDPDDDQKRTCTPKDAIEKGADIIVMGRSILEKVRLVNKINQDIEDLNQLG